MREPRAGLSDAARAGVRPLTPAAERRAVAVVALAAGVAAMAQTMVVPLLGELPELLHTGAAGTSWVVTATLLGGAVTSPVVGRLGDLYGKRRLMLSVLGALTLGSLLCAVADSLAPMVVGRALQGVGTGLVPLGISLLRDVLSERRLGSAIALTSSVLGAGAAAGLPLAAVVAQAADWHLLFWATGALTALIGVLVVRLVPAPPARATGRFDGVGTAGLTTGLTALLVAISYGGEWGWLSAPTVGLAAASVVVLVLWGGWERRVTAPLIDLRTTARRPVLLVNITSVVVGFALYAQLLMVPQLLQLPTRTGYGLGRSMVQAGLLMLPAGLAMMGASAVGARLSAARGPKFSLLLGTVLIGLGYAACLTRMDSVPMLVIGTVVTQGGVGFAYGAIPALIMAAVPPAETGVANGFNTLMRSLGTALSGAVVGAVFAGLSRSPGTTSVPSHDAFVLVAVVGMAGAAFALATGAAIPGRPGTAPRSHP
ncbi:MFS transporter [Streptomyces ziwulingensis]|uniref:MFS transporter n=1 Tax=Streptomyces ziwulingensis TaxID=1045501 RepID=A0ABP9B7E4_9ACTN